MHHLLDFASIEIAPGTVQVRWCRRGDHHETELSHRSSLRRLGGTGTNPSRRPSPSWSDWPEPPKLSSSSALRTITAMNAANMHGSCDGCSRRIR